MIKSLSCACRYASRALGISALSGRRGRVWSWRRPAPVAAIPFSLAASFPVLSVRRWSGAFPDRRYQRRLLTAPGSEAVFLIHIQRRGHLFEVVHGRPAFIAPAFPSAFFCSMSTSRRTFGAVRAALSARSWSWIEGGVLDIAAAFSAALAAFCSKTARTAARSKSSPSLRAEMGFVLSGVR